MMVNIIKVIRKVLKLAPNDPEELLVALERIDSFVSTKEVSLSESLKIVN